MLLRHGNETEYVTPDGGLLGVFEQSFEQTTATLDAGDRLLVYSDGFELAFPSRDENGETVYATEQYAETFDQLRHLPPAAALDELSQHIDAQTGSLNQRDDLTVLCLTANQPAALEAAPTSISADAVSSQP